MVISKTNLTQTSIGLGFGGTDSKQYDDAAKRGILEDYVPSNHTPLFAPLMQPTLKIGTDALCIAALKFLLS